MDESLAGNTFRARERDIAIVWDRRFRIACFSPRLRRFFLTEDVDPARPAGRVGCVPPRADFREYLGDGVLQRVVPQGGAMLVLLRAGAQLAPGADLDGVGRAAAAVESLRRRSGPVCRVLAGLVILRLVHLLIFKGFDLIRREPIGERGEIAVQSGRE